MHIELHSKILKYAGCKLLSKYELPSSDIKKLLLDEKFLNMLLK